MSAEDDFHAETYDMAPVGYFVFGPGGEVLQVNSSGALLLGRDHSQVLGSRLDQMLEPSQSAVFSEYLALVFSTGGFHRCDVNITITATGEERTLRIEGMISEDELACRAVMLDVSQLIQFSSKYHQMNDNLEQQVLARTGEYQRLEQAAREASRAKSTFLANMSHEIRTPMNGVIGMIDLLRKSPLNSEQQEMVSLVRDSASALMDIINEILDFSEVEAGKVVIRQLPTQVASIAESVCRLLERGAQQAGVELTVFIDPLVPDALMCDSMRLRQVLLNLVGNAIKFSASDENTGRVQLRIGFSPQSDTTGVLEVAVVDNGIGMDEETQTRIFDSFTQASIETKQRFGGTGLGVTISKSLIELMGGELKLQSRPGKGTTFTAQILLETAPGDTTSEIYLPDVSGLKCLVVGGYQGDDLACYLRSGGATVERLTNFTGTAKWSSRYSPQGVWIWLVDNAAKTPTHDELTALIADAHDAGAQLSIVLILHGSRRTPREILPGVITLDRNILMRPNLLAAVAMAAGRELKQLEASPANPAHGALSREQALAQGRLCLVAEDDPLSRKALTHKLALLGVAVDVVSNGREALACWRDTEYGLLITDLHMPEMDGFELAATIRREEFGGQHLSIIALSAGAHDDEQRALEAGVDECVIKPVPSTDFDILLDRWLPPARHL